MKGLRRFALLAFGPLAGCAGFSTRPLPPPDPQVVVGAAFVGQACAGCHAVESKGASRDPAAPPFRVLAISRSDRELKGALARVAAHGHVQMPPIYMTDDEQVSVLAYIESLKRRTLPRA